MSTRAPQPHSLYDFRMQDVSYEILRLEPGEMRSNGAGISGNFYHVQQGVIRVSSEGLDDIEAGVRDTVLSGGYLAHTVVNCGMDTAIILMGSEPMEYLAWLRAAPTLTCFRADSGNPLLKRLFLAFDLVVEELSHPEVQADQLTLERTAELIIFYFFRMGNPVTGSLDPYPWSDPRLMKAISAMNENPVKEWSVDDLAALSNMSRSAFSERFKALIGETPIKTLTAIRLKLAARKMLEGESIISAASGCGYNSEEAFNRAFKREFGITPGRWIRARKT